MRWIAIGGLGPTLLVDAAETLPLIVVPLASFAGALLVTLLVTAVAARSQSVATLLLAGIGVAALCGALVQALQSFALRDAQVSVSIIAWGFGTLDDRGPGHLVPLLAMLLLSMIALPFLHRELDVFVLGEDEAASLGVSPRALRRSVVLLASGLAGVAVAVAGPIGFVGLVVPNLVRLVSPARHSQVLLRSALCGALFLLSIDLCQRALLGSWQMRPWRSDVVDRRTAVSLSCAIQAARSGDRVVVVLRGKGIRVDYGREKSAVEVAELELAAGDLLCVSRTEWSRQEQPAARARGTRRRRRRSRRRG